MQLLLNTEDLASLPDAVRDGLLLYLNEKICRESVTQSRSRFLGDGTGQGNTALLYAEAAKRDGEFCVQCGDENDLVVDHVIPLALGGQATIDNVQLLCRKHSAIKFRGRLERDSYLIDAISVEAAIALLEGLKSDRSSDLLRAMVALGANKGVNRDLLMNNPDFRLKFKDGRSLNGVLTGIRKRFRQLFTESERKGVDIFEYDDVADSYSIGEGACSAIREAFEYFGDEKSYLEKQTLNLDAIAFYLNGLGTKLPEFSFGGPHTRKETVLVLPSNLGESESGEPQLVQEHFNFNGNWVLYGTNTESTGG